MLKRLSLLALGLALSGGAFAGESKAAAGLVASVSVSGGAAASAGALMVAVDGGALSEASLATMLPLVPDNAEFIVHGVSVGGNIARVYAVSRDGRLQLSLPAAQALAELVELAPGDTLTAAAPRGRMMVFSKGSTPLGFLLKPGTRIASQ